MAHRKVYTPEFKQQAVHLAQQSGNTNQGIASDLGISQSALSSWIKAAAYSYAIRPPILILSGGSI